jgi:predicted TIM-barrel fold metal-dependent hydrolase
MVYSGTTSIFKGVFMIRIDTHAHAFTLNADFTAGRRYTPDHAAPLEAYLAELDRGNVSHAVLVQPSFLGTDNSYLLECLRLLPNRLRGIAVVDPNWDEKRLAELDALGIVGIRLNVVGADIAFALAGEWQELFRRVAKLGWQIEIHIEGHRLPDMLTALWPSGADIVVDHFGRPDPKLGLEDAGVRAMLAKAEAGRIWIKLSGPYRALGDTVAYAKAYLDSFGREHLLWGSDWPWTQHSDGMSYKKAQSWMNDWVSDAQTRDSILGSSAAKLFRFDPHRSA